MAHQSLAVAFHLLVLASVASCARPVGHGDAFEGAVVSPPAPEGELVEGREAFEFLDTLHAFSSAASGSHDHSHDAAPSIVDPVARFHQHVEAAKDRAVQSVAPMVPQPVKDAIDTLHAVGETAENVKDAVSDVKNDMKAMVYSALDNMLFSAAAGREQEATSMAALLVAAAMAGAQFL